MYGSIISLRSPTAIKWQVITPLVLARIYKRVKKTLSASGQTGESNHHSINWLDLPEIPKIVNFYNNLSSLVMIYLLMREVLPVNWLIKALSAAKPAHCYFIGHFYVHITITRSADLTSAIVYLMWRTYQRCSIDKHLQLDLIPFMVQSDEQIAIFHNLITWKRDSMGSNSNM